MAEPVVHSDGLHGSGGSVGSEGSEGSEGTVAPRGPGTPDRSVAPHDPGTPDRSVAPHGGGAHLVLVGLPGAGKTAVGRALAERAGRPFLDFDEEIVRREGASVSRIFEERGEGAFRELERVLTLELRGATSHILSPGGGWMEQPGLAELLRPPSTIVYLSISPAGAVARLGDGVGTRPLLGGGSALAAMERLHARRHGIYSGADLVLEVEHVDLQEVIGELLRIVSTGGYALG